MDHLTIELTSLGLTSALVMLTFSSFILMTRARHGRRRSWSTIFRCLAMDLARQTAILLLIRTASSGSRGTIAASSDPLQKEEGFASLRHLTAADHLRIALSSRAPHRDSTRRAISC